MAKNRTKQRERLRCGMTKEERLMKEAALREAEQEMLAQQEQTRREEKLDLIDSCGIKDPTPYEAVKNIIRKERMDARTKTGKTAPAVTF